jgi:ADP-ribose pyrophosphatase YjhB (NUDIX family)
MSKQTPTLPGAKQIGKPGPGTYTSRISVRIIVSNSLNKILLISNPQGAYYTLPGGHIQNSESHHAAGVREVEDQTGFKVNVEGSVIAHAEEWREEEGLHLISYCYVGKVVAVTGMVGGKKHEWVVAEEAIRLMKGCRPTSAAGGYVCQRDLYFVEEYAMELKGRSA